MDLGALNDILVQYTVLGDSTGKGGGGPPLGRGSGGGFLHHLVNLLERQALGLGDDEVRVHERTRALEVSY
jgi:hypothetical protein